MSAKTGGRKQIKTDEAEDSSSEPLEKNPGEELWEALFERLKKKVPSQIISTIFSDVEVQGYYDHKLILTSADARRVSHIKSNHIKILNDFASELAAAQVEIKLRRKKADEAKPENESPVRTPDETAAHGYPNAILLNPRYVFERFVRGPSNEHAFMAAQGAALKPSEFHNPLYLYGGVGLGKTHLMMAIGNFIQEYNPHLKVQYTPAEIFQSDLVEAVAKKTLPHFKAKYRNIDVLLFDDIQFISQRAEYTQEEIFHTFNYLYQNKKQIVISGDRPPQQLSTLTDRLVSRFQSGLIIDIKPPSLETRIAILKTKAQEICLEIPYEVLSHVAARITGQIRVLEAALIKLKFISELEKHPIDLQMAKLALRDLPNDKPGPQVSLDEILRQVSKTFRIEEEEIKGNSRVESIVLARHTCMFLTRKLLPTMSLAAIAEAFGRSDHTTVIHAEKKIRELMDRDETLKVRIQELADDLQF